MSAQGCWWSLFASQVEEKESLLGAQLIQCIARSCILSAKMN